MHEAPDLTGRYARLQTVLRSPSARCAADLGFAENDWQDFEAWAMGQSPMRISGLEFDKVRRGIRQDNAARVDGI